MQCGILVCFIRIFNVLSVAIDGKKMISFTNNSTQVLVKIRCYRTKMLRDSDSLKTRLLFTKWPMIIVLNDFMPFLLTNRKENLYRNRPHIM